MKKLLTIVIAAMSVSFIAGMFLSPGRYSVDARDTPKMTDHLLGRFWILNGNNKWSERGVGNTTSKPTPNPVTESKGDWLGATLTLGGGLLCFFLLFLSTIEARVGFPKMLAWIGFSKKVQQP